jgi:hypothetical protein
MGRGPQSRAGAGVTAWQVINLEGPARAELGHRLTFYDETKLKGARPSPIVTLSNALSQEVTP